MTERDWERGRDERGRDWERGQRYRGDSYGSYGGGTYDPAGDRERGGYYGRRGDERSLLERFRDELASWFSAEDAERRRPRDDRETGRWGGGSEDDRDWARQWGYIEGRGRRGSGYGSGYGSGPWSYGSQGYTADPWYSTPSAGWEYGRSSWTSRGAGHTEAAGDRRLDPEWRSGATRGSFAGRGPRGYQRSDDRIREEICERMCDSAALDASDIEIVVLSGEVTLQGTVHDRQDKRLAEDLTEGVSGVREVNNQLRVTGGQQSAPPQTGRPGDPPRYRAA